MSPDARLNEYKRWEAGEAVKCMNAVWGNSLKHLSPRPRRTALRDVYIIKRFAVDPPPVAQLFAVLLVDLPAARRP